MVDYRIPGYGEQFEWDYPPVEEAPWVDIPVPQDLYTTRRPDPLSPPTGTLGSPDGGPVTRAKIGQTASGLFTGPNSFAGTMYETAKQLPEVVYDAVDFPAAALRGEVDPLSDEGISRAMDAAGTVTLGGGAVPRAAPRNSLRAGYARPMDPDAEHITSAAIYGPDGNIYAGRMHWEIGETLPPDVAKKFWDDYRPEREGFVTSTGRFVTREEADRIAREAGQIEDTLTGQRSLSSEDLMAHSWGGDEDDMLSANRSTTAGAVPIFSRMEREAAALPQPKAPGAQWSSTLKNKGVPQEELDWTGVADWLKERGTLPVTKDELLAQIAQRQTQVSVKRLGTDPNHRSQVDDRPDLIGFLEDYTDLDPDDFSGLPTNRLRELAIQEGYDRHYSITEVPVQTQPTKYSQYQLPGGENYREVLLTLPPGPTVQSYSLKYKDGPQLGSPFRTWEEAEAERRASFAGRRDIEVVPTTPQFGAGSERMGSPDDFRSSHWDEPNVLAHMRVNDRYLPVAGEPQPTAKPIGEVPGGGTEWEVTFPNGRKERTELFAEGSPDEAIRAVGHKGGQRVLFAEEIQSDWHQKGRREGYSRSVPLDWTKTSDHEFMGVGPGRAGAIVKQIQPESFAIKELGPGSENSWVVISPERAQFTRGEFFKTPEEAMRHAEQIKGIPDAPFKKTWPDLTLKRLVADAIEGGYDAVAWTDGATQAARYDLSKQVSEVQYDPQRRLLKVRDLNDNKVLEEVVDPEKIADYIGKEPADRLLNSPINGRYHSISGEGLQVGGEGMKAFYDVELPRRAKKLFGKYGATVENMPYTHEGEASIRQVGNRWTVQWPEGNDYSSRSFNDETNARAFLDEKNKNQQQIHVLRITPEMRTAIRKDGLPLYANKSKAAGAVGMVGEKNQTGTLRMSPFDQESGRIEYLVHLAEKKLAEHNGDPPVKSVPIESVQATQPWIDPIQGGGGDPVIGDLTEFPVLVKTKDGVYHIMDGHHRTDNMVKEGDTEMLGYILDVSDLEKPTTGGRFANGGGVRVEVNGRTYAGPKKSLKGRPLSKNIEDRRGSQKDDVNRKRKGDRLPTALESLVAPDDTLYSVDPLGDELMSPTPIGDGPPQTMEEIILRQGGDQFTSGLVEDPTPGRTDRLPTSMPADSYVIPADIVSGMGQGNTLAGAKILDAIFAGHAAPPSKAEGGGVGSARRIPVIVAGGEYVVPPDRVRSIGAGDAAKGHKNLDSFVKKHRLKLVRRLKSLDGPRTD